MIVSCSRLRLGSESLKTLKIRKFLQTKKPLMEKRRRAKINKYLVELKDLLLESLKRDPSQASKLEKADILEMTVHLLRTSQRQQLAMAAALNPLVLQRFEIGWAECAFQVVNYVQNVDCLDPQMRQRLLVHLDHCYRKLQVSRSSTNIQALQPLKSDPLAIQWNLQWSPWKIPIGIKTDDADTILSKSAKLSDGNEKRTKSVKLWRPW